MNIKKLDKFKENLKRYQYDATAMCIKYLLSNSTQNALVHLPTGTGKTGVMATLCALNEGNILIVVPNVTLPIQMLNEIKTNFWESIKMDISPDIDVKILNTRSQLNNFKISKKTTYISTIQFIQKNAYKNNLLCEEFIRNINENIDYIFFDEGHREPAMRWSQIIRSFNSKLILFTATPYRNDNSIFNLHKDYIYSEKMRKFIDNGDISKLEFLPLKSKTSRTNSLGSSADITNEELLKIVKMNLCNGKIIIRCKKVKFIENITEYFNLHNIRAIGIHSRIRSGENHLKSGKNIEKKSKEYDVFIHSEILIEGLNIPSIKTLIFLDTFSNFRSTTQQIGRVLRNNEKKIKANIYLPDIVIKGHEQQWNNLLDYRYEHKANRKYIYTSGLIKRIYSENISSKILDSNIIIPKRATIFFSDDKNLWMDLKEQIITRFKNDNCCKIVYKKDDNKSIIICYEETTYSNFLKDIAYENKNIHICVLARIDSNKNNGIYYFYYNSKNVKAFDNENLTKFSNSSFENINSLLDSSLEITKARYERTIPIISSGVRGREITGKEIENTRASLEQKLSFCSNMTGKNKETSQIRYINTITSRVSDSNVGSLDEYVDWSNEIVELLEMDKDPHEFVKRFASISTNPPEHEPSYIYGEFEEEFVESTTNNAIKEFSAEIENYKFEIDIGGLKEEFKINKDDKFKIISNNKLENIKLENSEGSIFLADALNKSSFRLYFLKDQLINIKGRYYKPNIKTSFERPEDWSMWNDIKSIKDLKYCESEKESSNKNDTISTWSDDSVFGVLLNYINNKKKSIDYLVCDDMGTEIADFIAMDSFNNKIIYIHCKHGKTQLSATMFQDICGQAMKNIRYIINTSQGNNKCFISRNKKWAVKWPKYKENESGGLIDRCIKGGTAKEISSLV